MSGSRTLWRAALLAAVAVVGVAGTSIPASATPSLQVIADHLKNPRKITVQWNGTILVAEAGEGLPGCAAGQTCAAPTGAIYRVQGTSQGRVVTGLPSAATISTTPGSPVQAMGPVQVFPDYYNGGYTVINGYDGTTGTRAALGADGAKLGTIERTSDGSVVADLTAYETQFSPDGRGPESNPYGFAPSGSDWLAIDAAGNDVVKVSGSTLSTRALLPDNQAANGPVQSVPTAIVPGQNGTYYIADMGGMQPGASRIWKLAPGQQPQVLASGLTNLIDLTTDNSGNLVALSLTTGFGANGPLPGALFRVDPCSGAVNEIPSGGLLNMPTGVAVGPQGQIYISNNGSTTDGQLVRLRS
ncbi:ScyD/ScyE family protein [Kitasatospora cineracea]|uniref:ScyD/ScyE family protein n=1 Tax=Kitasatospora cineracea TaxID=88074 RepID=UPI0033CFEE17